MPISPVVFAAETQANGIEPWVTDGTAAGTTLLRDIVPGGGGSNANGFTALGNGTALFVTHTVAGGVFTPTIWRTDGTAAGTVVVKTLATNGTLAVSSATLPGNRVLYQSANGINLDLWATDGTTAGTTLLRTIPGNSLGTVITVLNGVAVFVAADGRSNSQVWATDGTVAGTQVVRSFANNNGIYPPSTVAGLGSQGLFSAYDPATGVELWTTDGTAAGTAPLRDIEPGTAGSFPGFFGSLNDGRIVFGARRIADGSVISLWTSDGTEAGTVQVVVPPGYFGTPQAITPFGTGRAVFAATYNPATYSAFDYAEPWITDGTAAGTRLLLPNAPKGQAPAAEFVDLGNGRFVFRANKGGGLELWVSDGTEAGTAMKDIVPGGAGSNPYGIVKVATGLAMFSAGSSGQGVGNELWVADGTLGGTARVQDINPGAANSNPYGFVSLSIPVPTPSTGNDVLRDLPGNQLWDGGLGRDLLRILEGLRGATFSLLANGDVQVRHAGQSDTLRGVERIRFIDGTVVFDANDPAASVTRLYQAALGRLPDQGGLNFWIAALGRGSSLADLATGFFQSTEFIGRFGTGLSNADFVTRIYQNVLGRAPDAGGLAFWSGGLDRGVARGQTLAGISESAENRTITAPLLAAGIWDASEAAQQVARLYGTALGRLPDQGGLQFWTDALEAGTRTLADLAAAFVTSREFQDTYGALSNQAFVSLLYRNVLGREGEAGGLDFWTATLDAGNSRAAVTTSFSESAEYQALAAPVTGGSTPDSYGIRLA